MTEERLGREARQGQVVRIETGPSGAIGRRVAGLSGSAHGDPRPLDLEPPVDRCGGTAHGRDDVLGLERKGLAAGDRDADELALFETDEEGQVIAGVSGDDEREGHRLRE